MYYEIATSDCGRTEIKMKIQDIKNTVLDLILENLDEKVEITYDIPLSNVGIDSVKIIQLVIALEEKFDFEFEDEMLSYQTLRNINSISDYVFKCSNCQVKCNEL